jgi:hypothetical protein
VQHLGDFGFELAGFGGCVHAWMFQTDVDYGI